MMLIKGRRRVVIKPPCFWNAMLAYQWKPTVCQIQLYLHEGLHFAIAPTEEEEEKEEDNFDSSLQAVPVTFQSTMSLCKTWADKPRQKKSEGKYAVDGLTCARKMTLS